MRAVKCVMHLSLVLNGEDDTVNDSFYFLLQQKQHHQTTENNRRNYSINNLYENQEKEEWKKTTKRHDKDDTQCHFDVHVLYSIMWPHLIHFTISGAPRQKIIYIHSHAQILRYINAMQWYGL